MSVAERAKTPRPPAVSLTKKDGHGIGAVSSLRRVVRQARR